MNTAPPDAASIAIRSVVRPVWGHILLASGKIQETIVIADSAQRVRRPGLV